MRHKGTKALVVQRGTKRVAAKKAVLAQKQCWREGSGAQTREGSNATRAVVAQKGMIFD